VSEQEHIPLSDLGRLNEPPSVKNPVIPVAQIHAPFIITEPPVTVFRDVSGREIAMCYTGNSHDQNKVTYCAMMI